MTKPRNERTQPVTQFCLFMEDHRRTEIGRVRTSREFVANFFPHDESTATDKIFRLMPNEVRGPVLSAWGIRGAKAALKDDDARVKSVVHDALVAGDIDDGIFEDGLTSQTLIDWVALPDWWSFWRHGKLTGVAIQKALATARELELIDDRWFLGNIQGRGGKLKGTDVVCDTLTKDQIVAWIRHLHESGDGSPAGLVAAIGWETILAKTSQDALLFVLDAFAKKVGLVVVDQVAEPKGGKEDSKTEAPVAGPPDSGVPVAIPDIPAIDVTVDEDPTTQGKPLEPNLWSGGAESPKLLEARARMMEILGSPSTAPAQSMQEAWASDAPEKPSALEWPEPPANLGSKIDEPKGPPPPTFPKKAPIPTPRR